MTWGDAAYLLKPPVLGVFGASFAVAGVWPLHGGEGMGRCRRVRRNVRRAAAVWGREMVSWVVLANTYVELKLDSLRQKLDELYPGEFLPPRLQGNFAVPGPAPGQFLIQCNVSGAAGAFMLNSIRGPYTDLSDFAQAIADRAVRGEVESQCCWLSVDLVHKHTSDEDAYRFIGRLLAKLAPADAAFLVHPGRRTTIGFDHDIRRRLASGEQILPSPVTSISPGPPHH